MRIFKHLCLGAYLMVNSHMAQSAEAPLNSELPTQDTLQKWRVEMFEIPFDVIHTLCKTGQHPIISKNYEAIAHGIDPTLENNQIFDKNFVQSISEIANCIKYVNQTNIKLLELTQKLTAQALDLCKQGSFDLAYFLLNYGPVFKLPFSPDAFCEYPILKVPVEQKPPYEQFVKRAWENINFLFKQDNWGIDQKRAFLLDSEKHLIDQDGSFKHQRPEHYVGDENKAHSRIAYYHAWISKIFEGKGPVFSNNIFNDFMLFTHIAEYYKEGESHIIMNRYMSKVMATLIKRYEMMNNGPFSLRFNQLKSLNPQVITDLGMDDDVKDYAKNMDRIMGFVLGGERFAQEWYIDYIAIKNTIMQLDHMFDNLPWLQGLEKSEQVRMLLILRDIALNAPRV